MRAVFLAYAAPGTFEMIPATIALAAGVSFLGTGLLIHAARRVGWVDRAAAGEEFRKPRRGPVALVGGAALVLAGLAVVLVSWRVAPIDAARWPIAAALPAAVFLGWARPAIGERISVALVLAAPFLFVLLDA